MYRSFFIVLFAVFFVTPGCSDKSGDKVPVASTPAPDNIQPEPSTPEPTSPDPLAPSNWSLGSMFSVPSTSTDANYGELIRTTAGLGIKTTATLGRYKLTYNREFEDNLDIVIGLKPWSEEELVKAGLTGGLGPIPLLRLNTQTDEKWQQVFLPKSFLKQESFEIRIRLSAGKCAIDVPELGRKVFARKDSTPLKLCFDLAHNATFTISKLEVSEGIPFDEELAAAPVSDSQGFSGKLPPGFMPGGFGPGGPGPGGPGGMFPPGMGQGGFGPGGPNPNPEIVLQYKLPQPPRNPALKAIGHWYIPQQSEEKDSAILSHFQADDRDNSVTITKVSGVDGFWILRQFEPKDSMDFECRISMPSWDEIFEIGYDHTTLLAANLFPTTIPGQTVDQAPENDSDASISAQLVQCQPLPRPIPRLPTEATMKINRRGDQATLSIDGTSTTITLAEDKPLLLGIYIRGAVRFTLEDVTKDFQVVSAATTDETAKSDAAKEKPEPRSLADVIATAEASVVRIETSGENGRGVGSGFIVDDKGTLITNCHVLSGATSAKAVFSNGTSCKIVGTTHVDKGRDIVVAKIDLIDRPKIELSKALPRKGDEVIALGTPHGLDFTATRGIVSAIRQSSELPEERGDFKREGVWIQIDAPLSPGNSGGPLIDRNGQVIAMSTLASQGTAQNLNFGISADDVANAMILAEKLPLQTLADSTAKIEYPNSRRKNGPNGSPESDLAGYVPDEVVEQYIEECRQNFPKYVRELREEISTLGTALKEMEKGQVPVPNEISSTAPFVKVITPQKKVVWFFRNTAIKVALIEHTEERLASLTAIRSKVKSNRDAASLKHLAINYGPKLDARKNHEVGFVSDAVVIRAINDHEVIVDIEESPYLVWLESTVGLASGELILPCAVYVDGTVTVDTAQYGSRAVTRLRQVPPSQFEEVIQKVLEQNQKDTPNKTDEASPAQSESLRTWVDATGKYKIEAELVSHENGTVKLKRRDGTVVTLPVDKLSTEDREYLESLK